MPRSSYRRRPTDSRGIYEKHLWIYGSHWTGSDPARALESSACNCAAATAPPAAASDAAAFATIPPDQQATPEQFEKLFDVLRVRDQFQSFMKMMPSMVQQQIKSHAKQAQERLPSGQQLTPEQQAAIGKMTTST